MALDDREGDALGPPGPSGRVGDDRGRVATALLDAPPTLRARVGDQVVGQLSPSADFKWRFVVPAAVLRPPPGSSRSTATSGSCLETATGPATGATWRFGCIRYGLNRVNSKLPTPKE